MDNETTTPPTSDPSNVDASRPSERRRAKTRRQRGLTCATCRVRCEGTHPVCKTCQAYGNECRWEKVPPMSQVLAMAKRLEEAEETIERLRRSTETRTPAVINRGCVQYNANEARSIQPQPSDTSAPLPWSEEDPPLDTTQAGGSAPEIVLPDLSLDQDGKICFYGPTSAVHDPPDLDSPASQPSTHSNKLSKGEANIYLAARSKEAENWETFALKQAALRSDVPYPVIEKLLKIHWTWISPMFMWVYRPAFILDMSADGQYFSEFLLMVLCAHAARYEDRKVAEMLISKARLLIGPAIHEPSSIPTVQALLQLSARDLAFGSISQAWLYSGMAFRMAWDLGLHHAASNAPNLQELNPTDVEVRRRLFWSCYFWDKAISLYTGRMPAMTEVPENIAFEFLDMSSENEEWIPFRTDSLAMATIDEYPPMRGHYVSCFSNSCEIAIIINDMIVRLYSRRRTLGLDGVRENIMARLSTWRQRSPTYLRYDADNLPEVCPPPHILCQNIFAARSMERLLLLYEKTFGFENLTYLMAYCIYTGATVLMQDVKAGNEDASARMKTFTRALRQGLAKCPLLQRSLDNIEKALESTTGPQALPRSSQMPHNSTDSQSFIPAFPYYDSMGSGDFGMSTGFEYAGASSSMLDCFPEIHMESSNWWPPPV
ncbi:putative Zn(2)-C6 fungal-type domain-containing protein [Seiridium unicorne]|uniref:Zn(2)-C6 fungal-type domain-containing protein n=1 Tax=Seiridium unicorne TaxID=138068 RepID=A0ABR2UPV8_9PEZI